jgi:hypothetical protein
MTARAIPTKIGRGMAGRVSIRAALMLSVAAACAATSCAKNDDGTCVDQLRPLDVDDRNATGMTPREIASRFHLGDGIWSCVLSWASLGSQPTATWSPHDAMTTAVASLRWTGGATEVTGAAPSGSRIFCPPTVTMDLIFDIATEDGGFGESWNVSGRYLDGLDNLAIDFDPRAAGGFHGSHTFTPPTTSGSTFAVVSLAAYPTDLDGTLAEGAQQATSPTAGTGYQVNTASWLCADSMPLP